MRPFVGGGHPGGMSLPLARANAPLAPMAKPQCSSDGKTKLIGEEGLASNHTAWRHFTRGKSPPVMPEKTRPLIQIIEGWRFLPIINPANQL